MWAGLNSWCQKPNAAQCTREEVKVQVGWRGVGVISEREDLQDGSESRSDVWAGDAALTRGGAGGREMFVVSNEDITGTAQVGVWRQRRGWHGLYMNCCQAEKRKTAEEDHMDAVQPGNNRRCSEQDDMNAGDLLLQPGASSFICC